MENDETSNTRRKTDNAETSDARCQGCLTKDSLYDMYQTHFNKRHTDVEIYGEMLFSCYSIQVNSDSTDKEKKYFMCSECILKLKDAFCFKLQVEYTQAVLQQMFSKFHVSKEETHKSFNSECGNIEMDYDSWPESTNSHKVNVNKPLKRENRSKVKRTTTMKKRIKKNNVVGNTDNSSIDTKLKRKRIRKKLTHLPYVPEETELQCRICDKTFVYNLALKKHLNSHSQNFICEKCGKAFSKESDLKSHVFVKHESKVYTCSLCPRTYTSYHSLKFHNRSHRITKQYRCPTCFERFETYRLRQTHLQNVHDVAKKIFKCKECSKVLHYSGDLAKHIRNVHLMERKHVCQECGSSFFQKKDLREHMVVHSNERNFKCEVCHKRYSRKCTLTEHMKIHNNIKRFICAICDRAFTQKCTLKGHIQVHFKEMKK